MSCCYDYGVAAIGRSDREIDLIYYSQFYIPRVKIIIRVIVLI